MRRGSTETLNDQVKYVKSNMGMSHAMTYGDMSMTGMHVSEFQGNAKVASSPKASRLQITDAVPTYDVPYMLLLHQLRDANATERRLEILHEMNLEQRTQLAIRESMEGVVKRLSPRPLLMMQP